MAIRYRPFHERLRPAPREACFALEDYWVWCGSAVRGEDGRCNLFAARWPRRLPMFEGYISHSEVVRAVADSPLGPYRFAEVVLPDRGARYWDGRMTHNPTVLRWRDRYLLFYIGATFDGPKDGGTGEKETGRRGETAERTDRGQGSVASGQSRRTADGGRAQRTGEIYRTIRIGVATARRPEGPWERRERPVLDVRPARWDRTVTTNPAPCLAPDGRLFLYYRSNTSDGCRIGVAAADTPDGPFLRLRDEPILADCHIEDPYVFRMKDHYELLAKDLTGRITGELDAGVHAVSEDGIEWELADPPRAYSRTIAWSDGRAETLGSLERP
jgi:hypothetical protein